MSEQNPLAPIELIRARRLAAMLDVDASTVSKMMKDGRLPKPITVLGIRGWKRETIAALLSTPTKNAG